MKPTQPEEGLSLALQRAWRGVSPRAGLSMATILPAALDIADRNGVASLTLRKLGETLGTSAMALYRHIKSRDELLLLTFDFALGEPETPPDEMDWREALERWSLALYERYVVHPALIDLPIRGLPVTPNHSAWIEQLLVASRQSGLLPSEQLEIGLLLDGHARNIAGLRHSIIADAKAERLRASEVLNLMPADGLPELRAVLTAGGLQNGEPPGIEFGIRTILSGIGNASHMKDPHSKRADQPERL